MNLAFSKSATLFTFFAIITACSPSTPYLTSTPRPTYTFMPSSSPTETLTVSPTPPDTPTPKATPTIEEMYGHLAPLDFTYADCIGANDCFSYNSEYGQQYKEVSYQSFYTGNSRDVMRYDKTSSQDIINTEIQVVLRDETGNIHALWLPLGSQNFENNRINTKTSAFSWSVAKGTTQELLNRLEIGSKVIFTVFLVFPPAPSQDLSSCPLPECNYAKFLFNSAKENQELSIKIANGDFPEQPILNEIVIPAYTWILLILQE